MEMTPTEPLYLGILILTGAFAGVISGLLGVGGGFIVSPVQYWLLQETGLEPDLAIRVALGTSLFVVLLNASSVVLKYNQKRAVLWRQAKIMGLSGLLASFGGAAVATHLPASILSKIFGVCCHNWGAQNLFDTCCNEKERNKPQSGILCFCRCRYRLFFRTSRDRRRCNWSSNHASFSAF